MTPLIQIRQLCFSVGGPPLLDQANLVINPRERIGLVGKNGTGKSTFLKLLMGEHHADSGEVHLKSGLKIGNLIQTIPHNVNDTITSVIASGHAQHGELLAEYFAVSAQEVLPEHIQNAMTEHDLWNGINAAQTLVSRFDLDPQARFNSLSGGMKRRVLLAKALINEPEILLLDEPTNHLDIETIEWLEQYLLSTNIALVIVSHDRQFLNKLCNRIIEIDRGKLSSWNGNFDYYVKAKAKALEDEATHFAQFDKKLAQEEAWIRQGIKARRTRNEGRVRALKALREQHKARRERQQGATFQLQEQTPSGKRVITLKSISHAFAEQSIIDDFSSNIIRGDKIGIIGANGCGKSTLINIITGKISPNQGTVKVGTQLEIAYLDQMRSDINEDLSVLDNISGGQEKITVNGQEKHVISYVQDFLFSPAQARGPVTALSGGERNRLLLAKLFTKPCNLLILDEPTNDLDMETLELLEHLLVDFQGTLILVSHDRTFLNNVATSTYAFEGNGTIKEYVGGYDDWLRQKPKATKDNKTSKSKESDKKKETNAQPAAAAQKPKKLSYKEQRELDQLPDKIATLEEQIEEISLAMNQADFYQQDSDKITTINNQLKELQKELDDCYQRWEELE